MLEHVKIFYKTIVLLPFYTCYICICYFHIIGFIGLFIVHKYELQAQATAHSDILKYTIYYFFVWDIVSYPFCLSGLIGFLKSPFFSATTCSHSCYQLYFIIHHEVIELVKIQEKFLLEQG